MDVAIKKVAMREGAERFILVNAKTRQVITTNDVSEAAVRRFFQKKKVKSDLLDKCFERARQRYSETASAPKVSESADTMGEDDLLFELGLDDESNVR